MTDPQTRRGRRSFLLMSALFFAPVIAAYLLYFVMPQWQPSGKTHHGLLNDPAKPVPALALRDAAGQPLTEAAFKGKWSLVYLGQPQCEKACQDKLFQIRQIRTLLNEKRDRARRIYVAPNAVALAAAQQVLGDAHPDLVYINGESAGLGAFLSPSDPDAVYLFDPLGNWLMTYPASSDYQGILKDLKKLLRLSQIG